MNDRGKFDVARYWAGLGLLERLSQTGAALTSEDVCASLGTRSVKGIGAALSGTRDSLGESGIRLDEAVRRRQVRGRTIWTAGPRIRQARHALEHVRRRWTRLERRERQDAVPLEAAPPGHPGPVLVLRALKSREDVYRIDGGMAELDALLDDDWFEVEDEGYAWLGEIFIDSIESGGEPCAHPVPDGYGENGIWIRGSHDCAQPRVAGAIGTGRYSTMIAWIGEATWVERRIVLVDAVRQVGEARADGRLMNEEEQRQWRDVDTEQCFRYVNWIGARGLNGPRSAPPLRMRLRCWYEVVIETARRKRIVLREEGLRGDDARTTTRAIDHWRKAQVQRATEPVEVREIRIAKSQPRPMPPRDPSPRVHPAANSSNTD